MAAAAAAAREEEEQREAAERRQARLVKSLTMRESCWTGANCGSLLPLMHGVWALGVGSPFYVGFPLWSCSC